MTTRRVQADQSAFVELQLRHSLSIGEEHFELPEPVVVQGAVVDECKSAHSF
jgi:hypothetical protein